MFKFLFKKGVISVVFLVIMFMLMELLFLNRAGSADAAKQQETPPAKWLAVETFPRWLRLCLAADFWFSGGARSSDDMTVTVISHVIVKCIIMIYFTLMRFLFITKCFNEDIG